MTKRFKYLIILNVILLGMVALSLQYSRRHSTLGIDIHAFAISDTASITSIQIGNVALAKKAPKVWVANERHLAEPGRIDALMSVLAKLEIKKPVPASLAEQVLDSLRNGFSLTTFYGSDITKNLRICSYKGETYMQQDGHEVYAVYAPGYRLPLASWLNSPLEEWRDKRIFATSFKTLQDLSIEQQGKKTLHISFGKDFYQVEGVSQLDSMKLYQYLVLCAEIPCATFEPGIEKGKKPLQGQPLFSLSLNDISFKQPQVLEVYEHSGIYYAWRPGPNEAMTLDPKAVQALWLPNAFFERK